jgi:glycosyltransferase involved in cell wall biosynthesis
VATESRVFQQIVFFFCMKLIARLADGFIVPTKRFTQYLPVGNKEVVIITGCNKVDPVDSFGCIYPLKILFSGKLEFEHGLEILMEAFERLDKSFSDKLIVNICGDGPKKSWMKQKLLEEELSFISYNGFLSDFDYSCLLNDSDIGLVLQNPEGRYKNLKTPSKFFEYYSSGKYVLTSNVGDYENLPVGSFSILNPYTADTLISLIEFCVSNLKMIEIGKMAAYNFSKEYFEYKKVGQNIINKLKI